MQPSALTAEERRQRREAREADIKLKNNRLALNIFQGSWIMAFVSLSVVHWQLSFQQDFIAPGASEPGAFVPTLATIALLASVFFARRGLKAIQTDALARFMGAWPITLGLGGLFLAMMVTQWFAVDLSDGQIAFVYRLMIGYHALHTLIIGLMMVQVWRYARAGRYNSQNFWAVEGATKLWTFVVIAWHLFYAVLFVF